MSIPVSLIASILSLLLAYWMALKSGVATRRKYYGAAVFWGLMSLGMFMTATM